MLHFDDFVENNPVFRKFKVDELLFAAYDCPIEESPLDYWVQKNYFCYVIKGGARWKTPHDEYIFNVGDAAFLQKGAHRVFKILSGEFCALLIFVPNEFVKNVLENDLLAKHSSQEVNHTDSIIPLAVDQSLSDYFKTVLNYFSQTDPPSKSLLNVKFKELIVNLATGKHNPKIIQYFTQVCHHQKIDLRPIMEEHFTFNLKLEDFAELCGRSLATFKRDFSKLYQMSPGSWLKHKRLTYSKFLLETTDLNINEIAFESGFENTSHFIRVFKENYQSPPLKFRKSLVQD